MIRTMTLAALASFALLGCAQTPGASYGMTNAPVVAATVTPDACAWLRILKPDAGFDTRWTRDEKEYAVALNRNIKKFCR